MKITIKRSPTADTRTCDWTKVSKEQLLASSEQHISDVKQGIDLFRRLLSDAAFNHDWDKLSRIDQFHADFQTGFKQTVWWDAHRTLNRHHINVADGVPTNVNLIDVLEHIADCVMAGMARSGSVYDLKLSDELLQAAFTNTIALLASRVVVEQTEAGKGR